MLQASMSFWWPQCGTLTALWGLWPIWLQYVTVQTHILRHHIIWQWEVC
jgi:hypothetical protein